MNRYELPLEEGKFYHIYNQGNNGENLFYKDDNYIYFMKKFDQYLTEFVELFAFCLMPNHFHFLVRIKTLEEIVIRPDKFPLEKPVKFPKLNKFREQYPKFISNQFRLFFMSYSKAINKQTGRNGSLFREIFKRKAITSLSYLQNAVVYIHRNPQYHNLIDDFRGYRWSSYDRITEEKITKLHKREVLEWFGGKENYRFIHTQNIDDDIET